MNFLDSIILGVVEGFTEFLPISSTAHLILTSKLLGLVTTDFLKTFEISIQLGAIFAVVFMYRVTLLTNWNVNKKIIVAFLPTAIIGLTLYPLVKNVLLVNYLISVYALALGGIVIIAFEHWHRVSEDDVAELEKISYKQALVVGLFQSVAIIPGVSRAAATIIGGMAIGIKRRTIVEFSFLLAIPTMAAVTGLDLIKSAGVYSGDNFLSLGTGLVVSFALATLSIKFLLKFIQTKKFTAFGLYRILLALAFLFIYS